MCLKAEKAEKEGNTTPKTAKKDSKNLEKYTHLLIGKVKDTNILFSYILEASVVEQNGPVNGMS